MQGGKMSREDLENELRRETLMYRQGERRGRERDEALRRAAGWSLLLIATTGFLFALIYHPVRRPSRRAG